MHQVPYYFNQHTAGGNGFRTGKLFYDETVLNTIASLCYLTFKKMGDSLLLLSLYIDVRCGTEYVFVCVCMSVCNRVYASNHFAKMQQKQNLKQDIGE